MNYPSSGLPGRTTHSVKSQTEESSAIKNCQITTRVKNPAAAALGRLGGKKGGTARAKKLTKRRRREIARLAARARWNRQKKTQS